MRRIHLPRAALFVSDHLTGARGSFRSSGCTRTTPGEAPAAPRRAAQHRAERPPTGHAGCFGVCGLVCKPQGRSTTTGLKYSPVPSYTAPAAGANLPAPCATLAATSTPSCVSDPCPQQPHVCPSHCTDQRGGPNASTDADQLVARRSSDSAMDGGREERPEAAEASPNQPSIMPEQPGSASLGLSDSSLKQPTGAQRASGRASLLGSRPGASWPSELRSARVGRAAARGAAIGLWGWRAPARVQLRHGERRLPDGILHHGQRRRGGGCQGALCAAAGDPRRARTTRTRRDARLPPHCRQSDLPRPLSPPQSDFSHLQPGRGALSRACCRL